MGVVLDCTFAVGMRWVAWMVGAGDRLGINSTYEDSFTLHHAGVGYYCQRVINLYLALALTATSFTHGGFQLPLFRSLSLTLPRVEGEAR
jgi:hypothetical protein